MLLVGIDWAETQHAICLLMPDGTVQRRLTVAHSPAGARLLQEAITAVEADVTAVHIAIERPDGLLVDTLLTAGYTVYSLGPKAVERYRGRTRTAGPKSDPADTPPRTSRRCTPGSRRRCGSARSPPRLPGAPAAPPSTGRAGHTHLADGRARRRGRSCDTSRSTAPRCVGPHRPRRRPRRRPTRAAAARARAATASPRMRLSQIPALERLLAVRLRPYHHEPLPRHSLPSAWSSYQGCQNHAGLVSVHFVPGRNWIWYGVFIASLALYLVVLNWRAGQHRAA